MKRFRIYDNGGETADRYTAVRVSPSRCSDGTRYWEYVGMDEAPFHPQGFGQHGDAPDPIDYPNGKHLGRRIRFKDLPADCQRLLRGE